MACLHKEIFKKKIKHLILIVAEKSDENMFENLG